MANWLHVWRMSITFLPWHFKLERRESKLAPNLTILTGIPSSWRILLFLASWSGYENRLSLVGLIALPEIPEGPPRETSVAVPAPLDHLSAREHYQRCMLQTLPPYPSSTGQDPIYPAIRRLRIRSSEGASSSRP